MNELFHKIASKVSGAAGSPWGFILAVSLIIVWALLGSTFNYSSEWQLVVNTGTTIITFLMVFLIQNTQNRDAKALHLKLDELLKGVKGARTGMVDVEDVSDEELDKLHKEFSDLHEKFSGELDKRSKKA